MDQNLGRFEIFEVELPSYDPYPDPRSHLNKQLRITGESLLLRSPGICLSGAERLIGCRWYQKNIKNATLPGNIYASTLDCSLHEIDESRRVMTILYAQVHKFCTQGIPRIYSLLVGTNQKPAILELYAFLVNLQHNLKAIEMCVPGQNSGTTLLHIISEDPISRLHHCLIGRLLITVSEAVLCSKCPQLSAENFHLVLEFGDDLLRIAFLMLRFTYDVHPAIGSSILKYADRLGTMKNQANCVPYDKIQLHAGSYIPYFRVGERTDADTVRKGLTRFQLFLKTDFKYCPEAVLDLINHGLFIAANAIIVQSIITIDNLIGLWFCKQFMYKKKLARWFEPEMGPELIEELANTVYCYLDKNAPYDRMMRYDIIKHLQYDMCTFLTVQISSLSNLNPQSLNAKDHPAINAQRQRAIQFLTKLVTRVRAVLNDPTSFADSFVGPFNALYDEQDAYMNELVYKRLSIGSPSMVQKVLPLLRESIRIEACQLTTRKPDLDRLICLERWPKETVMHIDAE